MEVPSQRDLHASARHGSENDGGKAMKNDTNLKLSTLVVLSIGVLVVTMALPVYRAYAPAIKAPSARPPMPSRTEPRPGENECRARLLALAQAVLVYRSQYGHLPWHPNALSIPRVCPTSGLDYIYAPGEYYHPEWMTPSCRAALRDLIDNQIDWNRCAIFSCDWHWDMSTVADFWWREDRNDWAAVHDDPDDARSLGVTLEPSVGYKNAWERFLQPIENFVHSRMRYSLKIVGEPEGGESRKAK
jgi:hypothetical protein